MCKLPRIPQNSKGRAVVGVGPDMHVEFYRSSYEAEKSIGCPHSSISNRCSQRIKSRYLSERMWFWEDDTCWNNYISKYRGKAWSHDSIYEALHEIIVQYIPHARKSREFKINGGNYMHDLYERVREDINRRFNIEIKKINFNPCRDFTIREMEEMVVRHLLDL